jgi:hypothetical protein
MRLQLMPNSNKEPRTTMDKPTNNSSDGFKLIARIKALRSDQCGSVTLLAGMMVFLVSIFGIIALDTNKAISNRIIAQNAVDSAADSAALWQARGCNMLQQLNNLHYDVDTAACIAEGVAAGACIASAALLAAEIAADVFFGAGEALRPIRIVTCVVCATLPFIDLGQQLFYAVIMPVQQAIVDVTPFLAFGYANANAYGSGADPLLQVAVQYLAGLGSAVAGIIPGLDSVSSLFSGVAGAIGSALGSVPIYAAPLDPTSLELYVKKKDNDGSPPLKWPEAVGIAGEIAGYIGCEDVPTPYAEAESLAKDAQWDGTWGWDDQYFFGHPGFMTWIAGKKQQDELLGFGKMKWLNGSMLNSDYNQNGAQVSKLMYVGSNTATGNNPLQIPAFVAIASSEVEGTTVICHGDVNAAGKIIKVYFPGGSSPTAGDDFFIYH